MVKTVHVSSTMKFEDLAENYNCGNRDDVQYSDVSHILYPKKYLNLDTLDKFQVAQIFVKDLKLSV